MEGALTVFPFIHIGKSTSFCVYWHHLRSTADEGQSMYSFLRIVQNTQEMNIFMIKFTTIPTVWLGEKPEQALFPSFVEWNLLFSPPASTSIKSSGHAGPADNASVLHWKPLNDSAHKLRLSILWQRTCVQWTKHGRARTYQYSTAVVQCRPTTRHILALFRVSL